MTYSKWTEESSMGKNTWLQYVMANADGFYEEAEYYKRCSAFCSKGLNYFYSCGFSTATIEYSWLSVCLGVCLSVCVSVCLSVSVHDNSKNNG